MKIKKLTIDSNYVLKLCEKNLIFSEKNSVGKTTLLRIVLFSMGFSIPQTKGVRFNNIKTELLLTNNNSEYKIKRESKLISLYKNNEYVKNYTPSTIDEMLSLIFNLNNELMIKNILGIFYFDQERGWTLLNRGIVIGNIHFNIEELLSGMFSETLEDYINERKRIKRDLEFNSATKKLMQLNDDFINSNIDFSNEDDLENDIYRTKIQIKQLKESVKQLKSVKNDNKNLLRIISEYHLVVSSKNGEKIEVNKDNLENYNINEDIIETRIIHLQRRMHTLMNKQKSIQDKINSMDFINKVNEIDKFKRKISNIEMTPDSIDNISETLRARKTSINNKIHEIIKNSEISMDIYNILIEYSEELGIRKYIDNANDFILTSNLKGYSGAVLHLIIFAYKMALLKLFDEKYSLKLPIIIDSPATGELDDHNLMNMFNLITNHFNDHQLIVASINATIEKDFNWDNKIIIKNSLFESLNSDI